jgi:hypothetical protein
MSTDETTPAASADDEHVTPPATTRSDETAGTVDGDRDSSDGIDRVFTAWSAAAAGVAVTGGLAVVGAFWPALTVLAGAVTASGLLLARRGGRKRYLLAGVVYCLGLAVVVEAGASVVPAAYSRAVLPAAGGLGAISGVLVVAKVAGKRAVKRLAEAVAADEDFWGQVWEALAAFGSLLSLAWLLVTFTEKVVRYASVSVGAVGLLVANMLGHRVPVSVFGVEVEAVMALFVGCVLVWFHLLDTLHNSWRAVALSAEKAQQHARSERDDAASNTDG